MKTWSGSMVASLLKKGPVGLSSWAIKGRRTMVFFNFFVKWQSMYFTFHGKFVLYIAMDTSMELYTSHLHLIWQSLTIWIKDKHHWIFMIKHLEMINNTSSFTGKINQLVKSLSVHLSHPHYSYYPIDLYKTKWNNTNPVYVYYVSQKSHWLYVCTSTWYCTGYIEVPPQGMT